MEDGRILGRVHGQEIIIDHVLIHEQFGISKERAIDATPRSVWVIDLLVTLPSPYPGAQARPSSFESVVSQGTCPNSLSSIALTFKFAVESTKEFGGASQPYFLVQY